MIFREQKRSAAAFDSAPVFFFLDDVEGALVRHDWLVAWMLMLL
jgi:hypothetical protein